MRHRNTSITREAVLDELHQRIEGRHPDCQTITGRFLRNAELQQASEILYQAINATRNGQRSAAISPPPGWLLPI